MNAVGWSLYICVHLGKKDVWLGSTSGLIHLGYADAVSGDPEMDDSLFDDEIFDGLVVPEPTTIFNRGPVEILAERSSDIRGFWRINGSLHPDYRSIDIPAILPLAFAIAFIWFRR
ncbi:hypothetical protein [Mariniblastus fucicola]|uniref:hypothetical protein n=1 Tax=Mariniblastus fucicola TaxID=980251 RepID=UPI0009467EDF|nr:hypothetical protein [Mariniblastus fucicola]